MYNSKKFREELRGAICAALIQNNITGYPVYYHHAKQSENRFIVFSLNDLATIDGRHSISVDMSVVAPASDMNGAEAVSDVMIGYMDGMINLSNETGFYVYPSARNLIMDSSDPHTVRYHMAFDLYLYERN